MMRVRIALNLEVNGSEKMLTAATKLDALSVQKVSTFLV